MTISLRRQTLVTDNYCGINISEVLNLFHPDWSLPTKNTTFIF